MLDNPFSKIWKKLASRSAARNSHADLQSATGVITADQKRFFDTNGYLVLPGVFSAEIIDRYKAHLDELWEYRSQQRDVAIDLYFNLPEEARSYFSKAPIEARSHPYKILDLHLVDPAVQDACTEVHVVGAIRSLLGANPLVCNSLIFEWGSQQYPHFDTFFMPSATKDMMAASWIALDRVTETNGPLYYYPKSHLIEPYRFSHGKINAIFSEVKTGGAEHINKIVEQHGLEKELFMPEPGDVLIWHAQLLHGGSPIVNPSEKRRSIVTHYWTELDYPDAEQRIDLGEGRWLLKKPHQFVVDEDVLRTIDAFLATTTVSAEMLAKVPEVFDPRLYLARNQDILAAGENPWQHYINHGRREGRIW